MKYSFFPGCSLEKTAWDFSRSTTETLKALGVELEEIKDWVCCGSTPAHATDTTLAEALPALNLQKAAAGQPVMASCASCYSRFRIANHDMKNDPDKRARVEQVLGRPYDGDVEVRHVLDVLAHDVGLKAIEEKVTRPLKGIKVACYYGCLLTRPSKIVAFDNPETPMVMDDLVEVLGGEPVAWPYKTECCGASQAIPNPDVVARLGHRILAMAAEAGADCIAVACQMCQMNLDLGQRAAAVYGALPDIPVLYATQLLGLALGLGPKELGLKALIVSADPLLEKLDKAS